MQFFVGQSLIGGRFLIIQTALLLNELKASMKDVETAGFMADPAARLILR